MTRKLNDILLTKEELQLVYDAILFTSCGDVCMDVGGDINEKLSDLAIKLNHEHGVVGSKSVYINKDIEYDQPDTVKKYIEHDCIPFREFW